MIESVARVRILKRGDSTFDDKDSGQGLMTPEQRWNYYQSSYRALEPTEGVVQSRVRGILKKDWRLAQKPDESADPSAERRVHSTHSHEDLTLRIDLFHYKIFFEKGSVDWWTALRTTNEKKVAALETAEPENKEADATVEDAGAPEAGRPGEHDGDDAHRDDPGSVFSAKFVMNNKWMAGLSRDMVDKRNSDWRESKTQA